jgi:hypothetical protein
MNDYQIVLYGGGVALSPTKLLDGTQWPALSGKPVHGCLIDGNNSVFKMNLGEFQSKNY